MMAVSMEFLRGLLGFLGMGAAFMTGRSAVAVRKGWLKPSRLYGWVIRTVVCVVAVAFRNPVDTVDLIVWGLATVALAGGMWSASRQKPPEDLTRQIFPDEP
ncbi:MAG: hypothetical protein ACLQGV_02405 [Bryobacteraceae bacterium]